MTPAANTKERNRLIKILSRETAVLEWPSKNQDLLDLVAEGVVKIIGWQRHEWGGEEHLCAVLAHADLASLMCGQSMETIRRDRTAEGK